MVLLSAINQFSLFSSNLRKTKIPLCSIFLRCVVGRDFEGGRCQKPGHIYINCLLPLWESLQQFWNELWFYFFHAERQIIICSRAAELMTQESVHHHYKYSALTQPAHVPFHVLEWPVPAPREKRCWIFLWVFFALKYLAGLGIFLSHRKTILCIMPLEKPFSGICSVMCSLYKSSWKYVFKVSHSCIQGNITKLWDEKWAVQGQLLHVFGVASPQESRISETVSIFGSLARKWKV